MSFATFKQLFAPPGTRLFKKVEGQKGRDYISDLTPEAWQAHLGDGPHLGAHVQRADGTVHLSMFDIDISPRDVARSEMLTQMAILKPQALKAREALVAGGLSQQQVLVEFSGTGYHLWVFYKEPIQASRARSIMQEACRRAELELPFKPHNLELLDKDSVWLPLRINSNQHIRSVFVSDLESFDPAEYNQDVNLRPLELVRVIGVPRTP